MGWVKKISTFFVFFSLTIFFLVPFIYLCLFLERKRSKFEVYPDIQSSIFLDHFGKEEEYECVGSCFCENDERRSISGLSSTVTKSMSYVVAAASSIFALRMARKYFENTCEEKISSRCHSKSIKSEVNDCYPVTDYEFEEAELYDTEDDSVVKHFYCYGNCEKNKKLKKKSETREISMIYECKELQKEGKISVSKSEIKARSGEISNQYHTAAKNKFHRIFMTPFCRERSRFGVMVEYKRNNPNGRVYTQRSKQQRNACVAFGAIIRCRQIDPFPQTKNEHFHDEIWWKKKEKGLGIFGKKKE